VCQKQSDAIEILSFLFDNFECVTSESLEWFGEIFKHHVYIPIDYRQVLQFCIDKGMDVELIEDSFLKS
jgi:hypothetical protein